MAKQHYIAVKNARVHNLKNLSLRLPRGKLIAVTGVSGCGKSSFAFDTLFAEGQRRYVESLSTYARQFLGRMKKPEVDKISGLSPAISVDQRAGSSHGRSTLGTVTELYDYIKLLYARIGKTYSPVSNGLVVRHSVSDVMEYVATLSEGDRLLISCPVPEKQRGAAEELRILKSRGYTRLLRGEEVVPIEKIISLIGSEEGSSLFSTHHLLIDRIVLRQEDEENKQRLAESVGEAFQEGSGLCKVQVVGQEAKVFSRAFVADGMSFLPPSVGLFSFNGSLGACPTCYGYGTVLGIDERLVIPDPKLSVLEGAIKPFRSPRSETYVTLLCEEAAQHEAALKQSYETLSGAAKTYLWEGGGRYEGIYGFFRELAAKKYKIQSRIILSRYRGKVPCTACGGSRLRKEASYVKINGRSIGDIVLLSLEDLQNFFSGLVLSSREKKLSRLVLQEIDTRLTYLNRVGVGYLTLNRPTNTLSGGEYQRVRLAASLGNALLGTLYILDEPSIGLHARDIDNLLGVLLALKDLGNTVVVVEHEEIIMRGADQLIDIGPSGGEGGGRLVYQGSVTAATTAESSTTLQYLQGRKKIPVPKTRRPWTKRLRLRGAKENNLKGVDVDFPLGVMTLVTGVSGSGKSTLVGGILYPTLAQRLGMVPSGSVRCYAELTGDVDYVQRVEWIGQQAIARSSRSSPATYLNIYDDIRDLMARQEMARVRDFRPRHFSTNASGGRCEACKGEGFERVEMQFMADVTLECEVCRGKRFKPSVLEVCYEGKNIHDILSMTIQECFIFFAQQKPIQRRLQPLLDVGLGYLRLGQPSSFFSGGEAQRVKLAYYLAKKHAAAHTLFIFDEPSTGLHFEDIHTLLGAFDALLAQDNSIIVIEHNMDIIKHADHIIDLGPEGGEEGGDICFAGTPEAMVTSADGVGGYTARYLTDKLRKK